MRYVRETKKGVADVLQDLQDAVINNHFGVLHVYNLKEILSAKGVEIPEEVHILEVCNPHRAADVLKADIGLNMALPCRISVYTDKGQTMVGMISPKGMLETLSDDPKLAKIAEEVEETIMTIIDEAV